MELKRRSTTKSNYSYLDLLGNNELAIAKAFAHLLAIEPKCYFAFLRFIGIKVYYSDKNYYNASIQVEKKRKEGRTDIEISLSDKYHIIIECKIKKGRAVSQRSQYLTAFDQRAETKILCLLTQERDTNHIIPDDVIIKNITWLDIIGIFSGKDFTKSTEVTSFQRFATKNFKMKEIKEILIQDLKGEEIVRFKKYCIYRRDVQYGAPLYFSPYYTRAKGITEGISSLSKILGIITTKKSEIDNYKSDIESFSEDNDQVKNWIEGVKFGEDDPNSLHTYYFLDNPYIFKNPLKKAGGKNGGTGQNWIIKNISPNRCVTFLDFIKHIPELQSVDDSVS